MGVSSYPDRPRIPAPHVGTHQEGGTDELIVTGLSGKLADAQTAVSHVSTHEDGGADEISVAGLSGLLGDDQNPVDHASDHENGGGDEINVAGLSGLLADNQNPTAHATEHVDGTDDIQDATAAQKGLATAAQITKLDGIEPLAEVNNFPGTINLLASGSTSLADNTETAVATFAVTSGFVPMAFVSLVNDVALLIISGNTGSQPANNVARYGLEKTITADQYALNIRQRSGSVRDFEWRVYELGA